MKAVAWSLPSVGSTFGVAPEQSVAQTTKSLAATVPVKVICVAALAVILVGVMPVMVVALVVAYMASCTTGTLNMTS